MNFGLELVARAFPGSNLFAQDLDTRDTTIEALTGQHGQLTLGHIEPTAVLGGVVKLEFADDPTRFSRRQNAVQGGRGMGIEVIQDQANPFGGWEVLIHQQAYLLSKIWFRPLWSDIDVAPSAQGLNKEK